jgi:uncharacterized LabA/DUF88 family protein
MTEPTTQPKPQPQQSQQRLPRRPRPTNFTPRPQNLPNRTKAIYAFIDSQNLNISIQEKGWKLDWTAFRKFLATKYGVTKAFLFIGYVPGNETMYSVLQQQGYILIFKPVVDQGDGHVKGNIDAELVLRAMIEFKNYDGAIIVSGDGDFQALVDYLDQNKKLALLVVPNKERYSSLFKRFADKTVFLSDLKKTLAYKPN